MEQDKYLEKIFKNSEKGKLVEQFAEDLETMDKAVVILIKDKEEGGFSSVVMTLGLNNTYEAYGMLEVAKQDLLEEDE